MEYYNPLKAPIDITKSAKLERYYNNQSLEPDDIDFLNKVDVSKLFDDDTYNSIKYKTETYKKMKDSVVNGSIPTEQVASEMEALRAGVLYESGGQDIESINLSSLQSAKKLDELLRDYGVASKNDIRVRLSGDENWDSQEFKRVELVSSNEPWAYGILPSAKLLVLENGTIITKANSLYRK